MNNSDKPPESITGTVWYISNGGDDQNSGNSSDSAWATVKAIEANADKIKSGDAVLFKRGGEHRSDKCSSHIRSDTTCRNTIFGYEVKNNILDLATDYLFEVGGNCLDAYSWYESQPEEEIKIPQKPTIDALDNIYAQKSGELFGEWFSEKGIVYSDGIEQFIEEFVGDKTVKIYMYL